MTPQSVQESIMPEVSLQYLDVHWAFGFDGWVSSWGSKNLLFWGVRPSNSGVITYYFVGFGGYRLGFRLSLRVHVSIY